MPSNGQELPAGLLEIKGYAAAGGGRGVERVDVSVDGGVTWHEATRLPHVSEPGKPLYVSDDDEDEGRFKWAWVLWTVRLPVAPPCEIVVKAVRTEFLLAVEQHVFGD